MAGRPAMKRPQLYRQGGGIRESAQREYDEAQRQREAKGIDKEGGSGAQVEEQGKGEEEDGEEGEADDEEEEEKREEEREKEGREVNDREGNAAGPPKKRVNKNRKVAVVERKKVADADVRKERGGKRKRKKKVEEKPKRRPEIDRSWKEALLKHGFEDSWAEINREAGLQPTYVEPSTQIFISATDHTVAEMVGIEQRRFCNVHWGIEMTRFMASNIEPGETAYSFRKPLGLGGQARVGLWHRSEGHTPLEHNRDLPQNVAVKEIMSIGKWENMEFEEVSIYKDLNLVECNNILKFYSYKRYRRQHKHRLILEYAPHGNLQTLIDRYKRWRHYLPELFLWHIFHQLSKALYVLQKGRLPDPRNKKGADQTPPNAGTSTSTNNVDNPKLDSYDEMGYRELQKLAKERGLVEKGTKRILIEILRAFDQRRNYGHNDHSGKQSKIDEIARTEKDDADAQKKRLWAEGDPAFGGGWREIVHRDLVPINIFLGDPEEDSGWPQFPTVKLADFGLSLRTYTGDPYNTGMQNHWTVREDVDPPENGPNSLTRNVNTLIEENRERKKIRKQWYNLKHRKCNPKAQNNTRTPIQVPIKDPDFPGHRSWKTFYEFMQVPLSAQSNVFQLGTVMYTAMTLEKYEILEGWDNDMAKHFTRNREPPYANHIFDLIIRCLQFNPHDRPTPEMLYRITGSCLDAVERKWSGEGSRDRFRVFFREKEIDDLHTGFFKYSVARGKPPPFGDVQFPSETYPVKPPRWKRFHPYESQNLAFFPDEHDDFRIETDSEQDEQRQFLGKNSDQRLEDMAALVPHYYNCKANPHFKVSEFEKILAANGHGDPYDLGRIGECFSNTSSGEEAEGEPSEENII